MRTWQRARGPMPCGAAYGCFIAEGAAYVVLSGEGWQKVRCEAHAGQPVPADLDAPRSVSREPSGFTRVGLVAHPSKLLKFRDVKQAAAGDSDADRR